MEGWRTERLGDLCEIVKGRKPKLKALASEGDLPYLVARVMRGSQEPEFASVGDRNSIAVSEDETIIICDGSNSGEVFTGFRGILSSTMGKLVIKGDIDDAYLRAFLDSTFELFNGAKTGAAIPHLDKEALYALSFSYPPLPEQCRIVAILDEAFEGIATAKANAEKNLQNARELFDSDLQRTFAQAPPGADFATLGEVCKFIGGSQPPKSEFVSEPRDGYVRLIQIRDYKSDKKAVYIPKSLARRFCAADDVMIGRYGPPLFQILRGLEGAYNVALMKAVPDESVLSKRYLFHFLRHHDMLNYIIAASARAAGQIGLNKETIEPYPIYIPDLSVQEAIVSRIEELEDATQNLIRIAEQKLAALDELKKSLLHQAFSGQL